MTWYWYTQRPGEIFVDLDQANEKRALMFAARLAGAIESGALPVQRWFLVPSSTEGNAHAIIELEDYWAMDRWDDGRTEGEVGAEAVAWALYLLGDRYKAACDLWRIARDVSRPISITTPHPIPFWRAPDEFCECKGKHTWRGIAQCPAASRLGRADSTAMFGEPRPDLARETLRRGLDIVKQLGERP